MGLYSAAAVYPNNLVTNMSVGLDIGSKSIKIVELAKEGSSHKLRAAGIVGYKGVSPEFLKEEREYVNLSEVIKKLYREAKIFSKEVSVALPETHVFTRVVSFPFLTDAEIASAVKWEAEQYIPIPANEAVIQYQILEKREDTTPPKVSILLIAVQKKIVEKYAKVVEMAGLTLSVVETELMALVRALAGNEGTSMVVDFGARSTDIAISENGMLAFSRSIPTAGEAFTRAVSQSLGVEESQAEEYKRAYGLSSKQLEGKIKGALDPIFKIVVDEMKKSIHYYQAEGRGEAPKTIVLAGGSAGMPEATVDLAKQMGVEVIVGNPFQKVLVDSETFKALSGFLPLYGVSVGLALREV